jgi:flagellin-specific chaperone FliS
MGRYDEVKTILTGLRDAWVQAEPKLREAVPVPSHRDERPSR